MSEKQIVIPRTGRPIECDRIDEPLDDYEERSELLRAREETDRIRAENVRLRAEVETLGVKLAIVRAALI